MSAEDAATVNELWEQVATNIDALRACRGHDFSIDLTPTRILGKRWRCAHCGGDVSSDAKHWYEDGLTHARLAVPRG